MARSFAVLPCNGLDKSAGSVAREVALQLCETGENELICPVFYRVAEAKYKKRTEEKPLLVIDGCSSRCASKLAAEKGLKIAEKINISEEAKVHGLELSDRLRLTAAEIEFAGQLAEKIGRSASGAQPAAAEEALQFPAELHYQTYTKDKFLFKIPDNPGFYFNENDVWAYVFGDKARIGVTDFVQHSLSDIIYFTPPLLGSQVEQFEETGNIESGKAVFEIISPVSGVITAVNQTLLDTPELINQSPYEKGWILEMKLTAFSDDRELLHQFAGYFPVLKRKVDEFHV
ncbi:MAG: glycine cleavage system protein H [Negativicutes bacterium]|nr:glycine cleavage system protein H [Negativicutes bacterium]